MKQSVSKNIKNNEKGFTLIEILIAISIFAIGMLAVASMQVSGIQGNGIARALTGASSWAADRVERLISLPYDHADLSAGAHPVFTPDPQDRYALSWQVTENAPINNVKTIAVSITWKSRSGNDRTLIYNYYKADI